jgi:chromate reductase, NAD(P)H dehydrogenase (quinone)
MGEQIKLLGISGALRRESTNTLLVHEAVRAFGPCDFTFGDVRFPLYDEDIENGEGVPEEVHLLADQCLAADAVVISTPEYNGNLSGVMKNTLDWLSRTKKSPLRAKPVAIMSAADGKSGGARSQYSLRLCLTAFRPRLPLGPDVTISDSRHAFDENGQLKDPKSFEFLTRLMDSLKDEIAIVRMLSDRV